MYRDFLETVWALCGAQPTRQVDPRICLPSGGMNIPATAAQNANHDFIDAHREEILVEWESFARAVSPSSHTMDVVALRDHADQKPRSPHPAGSDLNIGQVHVGHKGAEPPAHDANRQ
jgi:hypothetical protein